MSYTVKKLSKLSGVSVRTLHYYDEIGLLKPAYIGANGYRFYEEEQLLLLQQILFFRELKMELKQIQKILVQSDFDQKAALASHRKILLKEMTRLQKLVKTIDHTIQHHKGEKMMEDEEIFEGFMPTKEAQEKYEAFLIKRLGKPYEKVLAESREKAKKLTQDDWVEYFQENNEINKALVETMKKKLSPESKEVRKLIKKHYQMMLRFYTPTKEVYLGTAELYSKSKRFKESYAQWHPDLADFLTEGMKVFAEQEL